MKKRDLWIVAGAALFAVALLVVSRFTGAAPKNAKPGTPEGVVLSAQGAEENGTLSALAENGLEPAESYLVIWMGETYQPVALNAENAGRQLRVAFSQSDYNVIAVEENGFSMAEASCPDQVCVKEGAVTLENRAQRVLGGYVICMPHSLVLELRTAEEMLALLGESDAEAPVVEIPEELREGGEEAANE